MSPAEPAVTVRIVSQHWINGRLNQLSDELGGRKHIVGEGVTFADLMLGAVLVTADRLDLLDDDLRIKKRLDRDTSRPAFRRA